MGEGPHSPSPEKDAPAQAGTRMAERVSVAPILCQKPSLGLPQGWELGTKLALMPAFSTSAMDL